MTDTRLARWATWREILSQPAIWRDWAEACDFAGHRAWVAAQGVDEVWFCGAGTSAFIGDITPAGLQRQRGGPRFRLVPSTEFVARPQAYLQGRRPLVVSFGRPGNSPECIGTLAALRRAADAFEQVLPEMRAAASNAPARAVFLGTGSLAFGAREAALKVMRLWAGRIACLWDRALGFRHGPKSFVTQGTRPVVFTGAEPPEADCKRDMVAELRAQFPQAAVTSIGPGGDIDTPQPDGPLWAAPLAVLVAQLAGLVWSDRMGLNVDDPFAGRGTLTRVVAGVKLYEGQP
ncbi:MAG: tagatose-bisphosphate aldolase [Rhodobacteraceae bacterium]|nr:tagatose-bisphosphate aldolase [Paracoccaceae bacterium]